MPIGVGPSHLFRISHASTASTVYPTRGVGLQHTWDELEDWRAGRGPGKPVLLGYVMTSDMGPDQAKCSRDISNDAATIPNVFFFHLPCLLHQAHLIVRSALAAMPGYFSSCAKICNVWRAWGNAAKIKSVWLEMFHKNTFPKTLPPRPLKGRWGSIEAIEQFLLFCGREELLLVYQEALLAKAQEKLGALALLAVDDEDDVRQYQLKIGRWVTEAVKALGEWSFWLFVIVGHVSRGPLTHMMAFIMDRSRNCQKSSGKGKRATWKKLIATTTGQIRMTCQVRLWNSSPS